MQYIQFVRHVQERVGLDAYDEAAQLTDATLETLGERLDRTEREHLAAQLPNELKEPLLRRRYNDRFPLRQFYTRVHARANVSYPAAVRGAWAVMAVIREAVSPGEVDDVRHGLPEDYVELFGEQPPAS